MIWTVENSRGMKLVDNTGTAIPHAYEFDDQTGEVKFYLFGKDDRGAIKAVRSGTSFFKGGYELVKASAVIKGAKMVPRNAQ